MKIGNATVGSADSLISQLAQLGLSCTCELLAPTHAYWWNTNLNSYRVIPFLRWSINRESIFLTGVLKRGSSVSALILQQLFTRRQSDPVSIWKVDLSSCIINFHCRRVFFFLCQIRQSSSYHPKISQFVLIAVMSYSKRIFSVAYQLLLRVKACFI